MKKLKYNISLTDGRVVEGGAEKVFVLDKLNVLTILDDHAPLIASLSDGKVVVEGSEYTYQEGFLTCRDNVCSVTILR